MSAFSAIFDTDDHFTVTQYPGAAPMRPITTISASVNDRTVTTTSAVSDVRVVHITANQTDGAGFLRAAAIAQQPVVEDTTRPDEDALVALRLERKRAAAIAALGDKWILHPAYKFNPRHSFRADLWGGSTGVLDQIRAAALAAGRL